jgi:arylsulfatase A-like enzyme
MRQLAMSRSGIAILSLSACSIIAILVTLSCQSERPGGPPNIIFVLADDLGWGDVGYHGSEIKTPNIDELAASGVVLEQHYVAPTCTPSRLAFLTGRYASRFGITGPDYGQVIYEGTVTLADVLQSRGYTTHLVGKWHLGSPPQWTPLRYGFTSSYGYFHGQIDPYTHNYKTGVKSWHRNDVYLDEQGHATDLLTDEAVRIITSAHERPFFLYLAYSVPHYLLDEPAEWISRYDSNIREPSRLWYAASVTHMDDGIGQIMATLDRTGQRDNTVVVFASDNGGQESWTPDGLYHGRYDDKPNPVLGNNHPLRGWKGGLYEGGIRVPALINWPNRLQKDVIAQPVHIVDWLPTFAGLAGFQSQKDLRWDGQDIWPVLSGANESETDRNMYWKTSGAAAIRAGNWKLIEKTRKEDPRDPDFELFDLRSDPYEKNDLASAELARVKQMQTLLQRAARKDSTKS